jgi:superfamily II DNA or RNA helicase
MGGTDADTMPLLTVLQLLDGEILSNLRGFQQKLKDDANGAYLRGARAVMMQLSTGGGKTVIMGSFAKDHIAQPWNHRFPAGCSIAHRGELLGQMSRQLAREGVPHGLIASEKVIRTIVAAHVEEFGRTFYNARSPWRVASVDTITKRDLGSWPQTVGMVHIDEAHHVLKENKWGKAAALFPNARLLLPTATPIRADKKGLGSHAHGLADALVEGPPMRQLIDDGYLTDYKVISIKPDDLRTDGIDVGSSGEFNQDQAREAVHRSKKLVGSIVDTYIEHARGKLGVTFAQDIEHAREICDEFNRKGIPAAVLTGDDDEEVRRKTLRRFANRELWQLINVDLFGEGFDLPAIECVSFGRLTASFALYSQMWGRALRLMISQILANAWDTYSVAQRREFIRTSGKPFAYIFDHVGNFYFHKGPPDKPRPWTLDAGSKRGPSVNDGIPMRLCLNLECAYPYERTYSVCPYCGTAAPPPAERGGPEQVDGDLAEIDPQILAQYRGEIARIDGRAPNVPGAAHLPAIKQHMLRQAAQHRLREAMAYWYNQTTRPGDDNSVNWRRFWFTFNMDGMQAMTLGRPEATALHQRIVADLTNRGIVVPGALAVTNGEE